MTVLIRTNLRCEGKPSEVVRVGIAYVLIAWLLLQAADFGLDLIDAPNWVIQMLFPLAVIGLPAVLVFSWIFEAPNHKGRDAALNDRQNFTKHSGLRRQQQPQRKRERQYHMRNAVVQGSGLAEQCGISARREPEIIQIETITAVVLVDREIKLTDRNELLLTDDKALVVQAFKKIEDVLQGA